MVMGYTKLLMEVPHGRLNCRLGTEVFTGMCFIDNHTGWACTSKGRVLKIQ